MSGTLVDSNVLLDLYTHDPDWCDWSEAALEAVATRGPVYVNPIVYAEISMAFTTVEMLEQVLEGCGLKMLHLPKEALFLAGKAFLAYRTRGGPRDSLLPDFLIGAHAAVAGLTLLTRDRSRFGTYFPTLEVIAPGG